MTQAAVNIIGSFLAHQHAPGLPTCAEIVFRHWQFTHNHYIYGQYKPHYPCTQDAMEEILRKMHRMDLVDKLIEAKEKKLAQSRGRRKSEEALPI